MQRLRVAIYRRVSTREQVDEGQSLQAQLSKITTYIQYDSSFEGKNVETIDFVDEDVSAKDLKRSKLQKLLQEVKLNKIDYVVVVKLDRLSNSCDLSKFDFYQKLDFQHLTKNKE